MSSMIKGIGSMKEAGPLPTNEEALTARGSAVALVLVASLGGIASALVALWLSGSILFALLAYMVGGLCLGGLMLAVICLRTRPISTMHPSSETARHAQDSLVFGSADTDLADRVNVNRITRQNTQWTQVPPGRTGRIPLVVQLGLGLFVLFALIAIDQV